MTIGRAGSTPALGTLVINIKINFKNYILVNKERSITNDEEYKFTLRNPITNQNSTIYVEYYLYHHVYFVGDTIK